MKIGIVIPDRGDRPEFIDNLFRILQNQSIHHSEQIFTSFNKNSIEINSKYTSIEIRIVNDNIIPASLDCDITKRYRIGYDSLRNKNIDVIFLLENDDYYSPRYLESMLWLWKSNNRPDIFGLDHTIYYHIGLKKYYTMNHRVRSSTMNTMIKPDLNFPWCADNIAYVDIHLWETIKGGVIVTPPSNLCLGIKHGIGKCGGGMHTTDLHRYTEDDPNMEFLKANTDTESFEFYRKLSSRLS